VIFRVRAVVSTKVQRRFASESNEWLTALTGTVVDARMADLGHPSQFSVSRCWRSSFNPGELAN